MADAKPFASLSSGLLARKGGAKPAMRPQGFGSFGGSLEDLGWNDMGAPEHYDHVPTPIDALTPSPRVRPISAPVDCDEGEEAEELFQAPEPPPILEQQRVLRRTFAQPQAVEAEAAKPEPVELEPVEVHAVEPQAVEAEAAKPEPVELEPVEVHAVEPQAAKVEPAEVVHLPRARTQPGRAKAAFTLRLDPERHLKLRLACALTGRSAQLLVTGALDQYLASHPEVEALAERVPAAGKRSSR
jgi:hypothetical protein